MSRRWKSAAVQMLRRTPGVMRLAEAVLAVDRRADERSPVSGAAALQLLARHTEVRNIIDVGASDGRWSNSALKVFPEASAILIEGNVVHRAALEEWARLTLAPERRRVVLAAAGSEEGEVWFDDSTPLGGRATQVDSGGLVRVPSTTIDAEVAASGFAGPHLIKLDTHGFELPILAGAEGTLRDASALFIEAYNFEIASEAVTFDRLVDDLRTRGFRVLTIADPLWRPKDGAFWQLDLVLVREDLPIFADSRYA